MRKTEVYMGIFVSLTYTGLCYWAMLSMEGAAIDMARWIAGLFVVVVAFSWIIEDKEIIRLDASPLLRGVRMGALLLQVAALTITGLFFTAFVRAVTEMVAEARLAHARNNRLSHIRFTIDENKNGELYIKCFACQRRSFNRNDITNLYCAHCDVFHHPATNQGWNPGEPFETHTRPAPRSVD